MHSIGTDFRFKLWSFPWLAVCNVIVSMVTGGCKESQLPVGRALTRRRLDCVLCHRGVMLAGSGVLNVFDHNMFDYDGFIGM
jgi:hypothetical protein